ncbi:MAG TPA: DNA-directed RNA polymerase subunit alpha [Dehalococcoidia bacterium]|jgi:DNA-directed RNA polymerase subunit alpha
MEMLEQQLYRGAGVGVVATAPQPSDEPQIEVEEATGNFARIIAAPLPPGFGITLGNALRRVLLSSLKGAAVTSVRVDGVQHEFSTIPNVKEDTIEFLLNVKELRLRALSDRAGTLVLDVTGRTGPVTAADIQVPEHYEIVNPDLYLATVDAKDGRLYVEFNVDQGQGYQPAGQVDGTMIGVIPVDAIFSPVQKVNYRIEHTRVGQATNYDKLTLEIWTDGTMTSVEAISKSAEVLIDQFRLFSHMGRPAMPTVERGLGAGRQLPPDKYNMAIEDLNLSMRAYNCLRRSGLMTVGQVLEKSEEELLALRNFGRKSYDELRERLDEMNLLPMDAGRAAEDEGTDLSPALPLEDDERPIGRRSAAVADDEGVSVEPRPIGRKTRAKAASASSESGTEGEEEIPDWKRALKQLTEEEA